MCPSDGGASADRVDAFDFGRATAVVTGAASGLGLAISKRLAGLGARLVMADVQADALDAAAAEVAALGAPVLSFRADVSRAAEVEALGAATMKAFGAPHLVFNNAGVSAGGLVWENSALDWEWVLGVNLMGVVHGVRVFTPMMLAAAAGDAGYRGRIVNTASIAGLINAPNMGVYNVSKHAVVSLTETLHHDLRLVTTQVGATVVCPDFVRTGIAGSARNRPPALVNERPATRSQRLNRVMATKAVDEAGATPDGIALAVLDAVRDGRFHVPADPASLAALRDRMEDLLQRRDPSDPFAARPGTFDELRRALGGGRR
jgi:NAD(P)-dependent dehydrogenase (short-subunit alcohol dehydrogenase family)